MESNNPDPRQYLEEGPKLNTTVVRYSQLGAEAKKILIPQLKEIFYQSSSVKTFKTTEDREEFFMKWCGDYLEWFPEYFYFMVDEASNLLCYLCVCPDTAANLSRLKVKSLSVFKDEYEIYPAHLHMNTHENYRGIGLGAMILTAVEADLRLKKIKGLHLITEPVARNFEFYKRQGFTDVITKEYSNTQLSLMGKDLNS